MTCRVELCRIDFQHENAYAAVQSAAWLCNIYGVNVGCPGEVTGNRNTQLGHWGVGTGTICFWSSLFYALIPVGTTHYALHFYLLCLKEWLTLMLKNALKQSQCYRLSSEGRGNFNRSSKETVLEIVLSESESDVGIELEVAELQATELELSSAMLFLLPLTWV